MGWLQDPEHDALVWGSPKAIGWTEPEPRTCDSARRDSSHAPRQLGALHGLFESKPLLAISAAVRLGRSHAAPWLEQIMRDARLPQNTALEEAARRAVAQLKE